MRISEDQKDKLKKARESNCEAIAIRLTSSDLDGSELYIGTTSGKGFETVGNGLYLMKQGGRYDGRGMILGPNSPFKNIPILGMIL